MEVVGANGHDAGLGAIGLGSLVIDPNPMGIHLRWMGPINFLLTSTYCAASQRVKWIWKCFARYIRSISIQTKNGIKMGFPCSENPSGMPSH